VNYVPLRLGDFCNVGTGFVGQSVSLATGAQLFQGLPFDIGQEASRCYVGFGREAGTRPIILGIKARAYHVIFAHRLLESYLTEGANIGNPIARYVFRLAGGREIAVDIRERFQIGVVPAPVGQWAQPPFLAVPDQKDSLMPRYEGRWDDIGLRQVEAIEGEAQSFWLWAWRNPSPDCDVESLTIEPMGPKFIIAAITLGQVDEPPFVRTGAQPVVIDLLRNSDAAKQFDLEVEVDRGVATYPYPLPRESSSAFLSAPLKGFGEAQNEGSTPSYFETAAIPSATLIVRTGAEELSRINWGTLTQRRSISTDRVSFQLVDPGKNWVKVTVLDEESRQAVPCRIHFRSPDGIPFQPHGHPNHANSNLGSWHVDNGGDVRLGQVTYAYIDGRCEGWLPRGEVLVDVARGFEYEPLRSSVTIRPGQRELTLRLRRWTNMNSQGWFSGDSHVHFLGTQGAHLEAQGEDLNVVNLLQTQWGHLFTNAEDFVGGPSVTNGGRTIVYCSQENRQHVLGHLILWGLKAPVMPWCTDGPAAANIGGTLEETMSGWADACHQQGGTVVFPHFPNPLGELPVLIATQRLDAIEWLHHDPYKHLEYYRYLDAGYRLPLVGGTDKMSSDVPVGIYRTYAYIPDSEPFTHDTWTRAVRAGRTFLTSGPLLSLRVDGAMVGDTLQLSPGGGTIEVEAVARSIFPVHTLELVQAGQVVAATSKTDGARELTLKTSLSINGRTWLVARCGGPGYSSMIEHHTISDIHRPALRRAVFAHTSPVYIACGNDDPPIAVDVAEYMMTLVEGGLEYIRNSSRQYPPTTVTHHHGEADHLAYLERPYHQAREAILRRLRRRPRVTPDSP
jgi:hypothetical protein